jgi:hypothetical protein
MKQRTIYCPGPDKWVPLGAYIKAVKKAKSLPNALFPYGITTWSSCYGWEIVEQFRKGMLDRIAQGISCLQRGKSKLEEQRQKRKDYAAL